MCRHRPAAAEKPLPRPLPVLHAAAMRKRREARERALQFLFQDDLNPSANPDEALNQFWDTVRLAALQEAQTGPTYGAPLELPLPTPEEIATRMFADALVRGVLQRREELDGVIQRYAKNWDLPRIAVVDRNILRMAIHEILHRDDIPPVVSINEAIEIAKRYSTEQSGRFVNGILDKVKADTLRPARTSSEMPTV
jgi:N utilization substance protein B